MPHFERAAGILLHITSLPGRFGIGDLGSQAYKFVDFLSHAEQRIWQLLPIGPTVQSNSPYSCYSAFAGNPLVISPEMLVQDGYLSADALRGGESPWSDDHLADFEFAYRFKSLILREAFEYFRTGAACRQVDEFEIFCTKNRWWLDDFALFAALMRHFGSDQWTRWPAELVSREPSALSSWRERLAVEVEYEQFVQFLFFSQWDQLKRYAAAHGVRLFGDMPIFVAHGSADVWAHQSLFWLQADGQSKLVAGVPPDYFSKTGQLWGNPLYNWAALAETDYRWWTQRFRMAFQLYDLLRIDHFRGFEAYWEVPAGSKTAVEGRWAPGPGRAPFDAARRALGDLPIVAEDLGLITDEVHQLRDELGFPGMRILQFGFDKRDDTFHRPMSYPSNSVAYTGTHDNSTIVGWLEQRSGRKQDILRSFLQDPEKSGMPLHWQLISMVLHSQSHTAIVPLQDVLGLDDRSRMNIPGQAFDNWGWRFTEAQLSQELTDRLRLITIASDRGGEAGHAIHAAAPAVESLFPRTT